MTEPDIRSRIAGEIYRALERLDADDELLSIIGPLNDTDVLTLLREFNAGRPTLHRPQ